MMWRWMARTFAVVLLIGATINLAAATQPSVAITSPQEGATVAGANVPLVVEAKGSRSTARWPGRHPSPASATGM